MTDKEKRELKDGVINIFKRFNILNHTTTIGGLRDDILEYIDSLQEEPVSEFLNTESMIESYKQRLISQANGVKDSPLIDMCLASYKHGINETLDTLNLSNVQRTVKNWKEPVSEDLKEAAKLHVIETRGEDVVWDENAGCAMLDFKAGAQWQKEQMMANTADAMIGLPYENKDGGYTHFIDVSRPLPAGNNKIAIIFKED